MEVPLSKMILTAFSGTASRYEFVSDPKFCKNNFFSSALMFWNCLIFHRIDTKLYILRKRQQACFGCHQVSRHVGQVSFRVSGSFYSRSSTIHVGIHWKTQCDSVFLKARSLMILFLTLCLLKMSFFMFLLCSSVVRLCNQRRCSHPSVSLSVTDEVLSTTYDCQLSVAG